MVVVDRLARCILQARLRGEWAGNKHVSRTPASAEDQVISLSCRKKRPSVGKLDGGNDRVGIYCTQEYCASLLTSNSSASCSTAYLKLGLSLYIACPAHIRTWPEGLISSTPDSCRPYRHWATLQRIIFIWVVPSPDAPSPSQAVRPLVSGLRAHTRQIAKSRPRR